MLLQPKRPPGRADRKAGAWASEIVRLRAEGYTYEAIREALAEVGVELSASALRREVRRPRKLAVTSAAAAVPATPMHPLSRRIPPVHDPGRLSWDGKSGRDIAEAFFNAHSSNPLFPTKADP